MNDLQELISRGRFLLSNSPKRIEVFKLVNGKLSAKEIATKVKRSLSSVLQDLEKLRDFELIQEKKDSSNNIIKKNKSTILEKTSLVKHISINYFEPIASTSILVKDKSAKKKNSKGNNKIKIPNEKEILEISKNGEDQMFEFKAPGVGIEKITREVAGLLHTKNGGIVFYGIDDDGTIIGSDIKRQDMDQRIQNSTRNTINPHPNVDVVNRNIMGSDVLLIVVNPWDKKTIYQFNDQRYYIRKGTNVFALKPDELKKLHHGQYVI